MLMPTGVIKLIDFGCAKRLCMVRIDACFDACFESCFDFTSSLSRT